MELFESDWFFNLVESHGKKPAARLTAVFSVASTWMSAPGIHQQLEHSGHAHPCLRLKDWLIAQAREAKARNPAMLSTQLLILLHGAVAEELRTPGSRALENAASAAQAVVAQACRRPVPTRWIAVAASFMSVLTVGAMWYTLAPTPQPIVQVRLPAVNLAHFANGAPVIRSAGLTPDEMESLLVLQDRIQRGICPAPNLLVLPEGQVTAYMNAVNFRVPENREADRQNIRKFLAWFDATRATECYFAPHNGHTQTVWR